MYKDIYFPVLNLKIAFIKLFELYSSGGSRLSYTISYIIYYEIFPYGHNLLKADTSSTFWQNHLVASSLNKERTIFANLSNFVLVGVGVFVLHENLVLLQVFGGLRCIVHVIPLA